MEIGPLRTACSPVPIEGTLAARAVASCLPRGLSGSRSDRSDADHDLSSGTPALGLCVGFGDPLDLRAVPADVAGALAVGAAGLLSCVDDEFADDQLDDLYACAMFQAREDVRVKTLLSP
ncbi:hypothetical protein ABT275_41175 [Streptomyces sp. NPDC001185]|uniref:hypothetical protein n=1 Tax=Streptomyces sp. NPDC001185 TaxID=3154380 RepID=UPI00331F7D52